MFFAMRHEVAENRVRKSAKYPLVPEWQRGACLKCGGMAKVDNGGTVETRKCTECNFAWQVDDGVIQYPVGKTEFSNWTKVKEGLLLILWEKEL